ncbi:MAG: hypothetical protein M1540_00175 [Candidatus Bathyarchaeota archaeon]|nr:hypothetical protein [Candidatus Bathyarchaeota archaeon]
MMQYQAPLKLRVKDYFRSHEVSLGLFLASYGVFYLTVVIMGGWSPSDWGKDTFDAPVSAVQSLIPRSYIAPLFFVTSIPTLIIGATILCAISVRALRSGSAVDEHIAIVLTAFGFAYQIVGAWPLQSMVDLPWQWQKQIMSFGPVFGWGLYVLSWVVLAVGGVSLYVHSRNYHREHSDFSVLNE